MRAVLGWVVVGCSVAYVLIGEKLAKDAMRYLRDPNSEPWGRTPIFSPDRFTQEGEPLRRRAVRFYRLGAVGLAVLYTATWLLPRLIR